MKAKHPIPHSSIPSALCWLALPATSNLPLATCHANPTATASLTPSTVSNTYPGQITLQISGLAAGGSVLVQNYTVLTTTNLALPLSSWTTVLVTNLAGHTALIQDNQATGKQRFYRVLLGP